MSHSKKRSLGSCIIGLLACLTVGCSSDDDQYNKTWYSVDSLSVTGLANDDSEPAVFLLDFQMTNKTDTVAKQISDFRVTAGSLNVDFGLVGLYTQIGTCADSPSVNPIFTMPPGEKREIRARLQVSPPEETSLLVSCDDHYTDPVGFENGIQYKGVWSKTGALPATYSGAVGLDLVGAREPDGPGVNFECSTRATRTQRP